jgi:2-isopropylmalate synthase
MRRIEIYDTTLRDGAQGEGVSFSLQDKLAFTERLDRLGFDYVEGGYPASNEKDFSYFQRVKQLKLEHVKVCAFGMTRRKTSRAESDAGLKSLVEAGTAVVTLVGKASAFQATDVLQTTLDENLAMIRESVAYLVAAGRRVIFDAEHFYDGWKQNPEYAMLAIRTAAEAGAASVTLCDTNGGGMTDEIAAGTAAAVAELSVPVGIHCHNDCDVAVAATLSGVDAGACLVQGTINGFGERCGNADLISIVADLSLKKQGYAALLPDSVARLTELSRYVYETANVNFRANQPFVGKSAFAHKGGMHVSGIARVSASYEHIDPQRVGNERRILVSELSGRSNIMATTTTTPPSCEMSSTTTTTTTTRDPSVDLADKILAEVVSKENAGYQFEAADASYEILAQKCRGAFRPHFETLHYDVKVDNKSGGEHVTAEAIVKIRICVDGRVCFEAAEGNGPVDALNAALRKALNGRYPSLNKLHLVDYKVRVINSEAATAAGVRVLIQSQDESDVWGTVGVDENIIEASWIALVDSFEYKLWKDELAASG